MSLTLAEIHAARERVRPHVVETPLLRRQIRDDFELIVKPESLQPTGAFKLRGAFSVLTALPEACPGVVTHSSGNHAQAIARAARVLGLNAVVVMPSDAPELKRRRTEADGAEIVTVGTDSEERRLRAEQIAHERGLRLVSSYDEALIAAGQGTAALEFLEQLGGQPLDRFYCPVSGGGLMAGCSTVLSERSPQTEIVGVEPEDGDDTKRSLEAGVRVTVDPPATIADGLRVRSPGEFTWPINQRNVSRIETVTDDELLDAMAWALGELRLVLEPSGAASLAVALREGHGVCLALLSGGNADPDMVRLAAARLA